MKLDPTQLRYMSKDDFRLLSAVETGSRNHELVPVSLISNLAHVRPQTVSRRLHVLSQNKLVGLETNSKYDGVRLTYGGYDFLALRALSSRESVLSIGRRIGVGKESDVYLVHGGGSEEMQSSATETDDQCRILKIHRLGRTSFRTVKANRDYHQHRSSCSWLYLSRLAASLEFRFMCVLHEVGLPVPKPLDANRHCVLMEWIREGVLMDNVHLDLPTGRGLEAVESESEEEEEEDSDHVEYENVLADRDADRVAELIKEEHVPGLYARLMALICELASYGIIHGDYNEFNILLLPVSNRRPRPQPVLIDFPQMVSIDHSEAQFYFERDVECIRIFFARRFGYRNVDNPEIEPVWEVARQRSPDKRHLDVEMQASGYIKPRRIRANKRTDAKSATGEGDVDESLKTDEESESEVDVDESLETDEKSESAGDEELTEDGSDEESDTDSSLATRD